jgi:hypothetical protein
MSEYQIQANTRRCAATGRELRPGERYYSVLLEEAGKFVRKDYGAESWRGAPAGAFSFWQGRITTGPAPRKMAFDDDLLADCFHRLEGEGEPSKLGFRYVLALLLMRRKRFQFEEVRQEKGQEALQLRCTRTGARFRVIDPGLTEEEIESVQEDVFQALGWE